MNSEQNKNINETDNNDCNGNTVLNNNFLTLIKDKIKSLKNKEELDNALNNEEESKTEKDVLKTENKKKEEENYNISKLEEDINNKTDNLINDNTNIQSLDENNNDNKNSINSKLIEEKSIKNEIIITKNQENINNTKDNIDINILKENQKEENIIIQENMINKEDSNINENQNNNKETDNNKVLAENYNNQNKIEQNNNQENNNNQDNEDVDKDVNINIKKEEKEKEKEEEKHTLNYSCLNKCIQWSLNIDIKSKPQSQFPSDFKSQYLFQGSSIFFNKLEQSLINSLHNPQNIASSLYKNMPYQLILESIKSESNKKLELINQTSLEKSNILKDLLNYSFPIDNTKPNYFFINANLSMKDNLKNIFLIEFNLEQNKEEEDNNNEQDFRKINDFCVEKEIYFKLNGYYHGKKMFKNDLTFSVGYHDFIKGIQFQIKSKLQKNKNISQNNPQNIIFAKVLNNANIGIEFFVPLLNENSQTNFNAIVNSHIEIKKIFLELTIPNNLIKNIKSNTSYIIEGFIEDSNSISTKRTEINTPKKEENNISNSNSNHNSNKNVNFNINKNNIPNKNINNNNNNNLAETIKNYLFNSNISSPNQNPPNLIINRSIPASPHINNYPQYFYQQKYYPLINPHFNNNNNNNNNNNINNFNLAQNNFRPIPNQNSFYSAPPNYPLSPAPPQPQQIFCSPQPNINSMNTYSPLSSSVMMMKMPYKGRIIQQQPLSMNSPFNTSNYSSPYMGQNVNRNTISHNSSNNRKNSESFAIDNQLNNFKRQVYNNNQHHTPLIMRGNEEDYINKFLSPKSMGPSSSFNLENYNMMSLNLNDNNKINGSFYQFNPMNNINQMKQQMNQLGTLNQMGNVKVIPMIIRKKITEKKNEELEKIKINKLLNTMNRIYNNNNNININNFNNSSTNNNIRTNIIKNNIISNINLNNPNNINNFNNINAIKSMANIHNMQNGQNIQNIKNMNNNINLNMNINNNINRVNSNINYPMNVNNEKIEMNEKQKIKNLFIIENQNKNNLDLFLKAVTPFYKLPSEIDFSKMKIQNIFDNLKLISLLGLKTIYFNKGELLDICYSLSLSSLFIKITNKQLIIQIFQEIKNRRKDLENLTLNQNEEITISESLFTLYFTTQYLEINYAELKPEYSRKSYNALIKSLKKSIPFFGQISLEDIDKNKSYFALLYSSVKILKPFTPHSLVVYYNFNNEYIQENKKGIISNNEKFYKQSIVGILPLKINSDFFMQKIIFKQPKQPYGFFNQDNFPLMNMSYNILNDIQKYTRINSYDFELFIKLKNHNYNRQ